MYSWFLSLGLAYQLLIAFFTGAFVSFVLMMFLMFVKNNKVKAYQRQLEKESITSDENSARVKVLEQKIEVLEKALEKALKG